MECATREWSDVNGNESTEEKTHQTRQSRKIGAKKMKENKKIPEMFGGVDGCPTLFARYLIIVWNVIITSPRVCWCVADRGKKNKTGRRQQSVCGDRR